MNENDGIIQDVINRVLESGSVLSLPMEVEFFIVVSNKKVGKDLEIAIKNLGYETSLDYDSEYKEWTLYCVKMMLLSIISINNEEDVLSEIAKKHGCKYDGFQTAGNFQKNRRH